MDICIKSNHFTKTEKRRLTDLAQWTGLKLMGGRLSRHINLKICTTDSKVYKKTLLYAYVDYDDTCHRTFPRNFTITMTGHFGIMRSMFILAHEMVHVKQFATGELYFCPETGKEKWKGKNLNYEKYNYWDLPYEIEAHGREKGLVYQYCDIKKLWKEQWCVEVF